MSLRWPLQKRLNLVVLLVGQRMLFALPRLSLSQPHSRFTLKIMLLEPEHEGMK